MILQAPMERPRDQKWDQPNSVLELWRSHGVSYVPCRFLVPEIAQNFGHSNCAAKARFREEAMTLSKPSKWNSPKASPVNFSIFKFQNKTAENKQVSGKSVDKLQLANALISKLFSLCCALVPLVHCTNVKFPFNLGCPDVLAC